MPIASQKMGGVHRGGGSQLNLNWIGTRVVAAMDLSAREALVEAADEADDYWRNTVWGEVPNDEHPDATGRERDHGHFTVEADPGTHTARMTGYVDLDEDYPIYEEFGTGHRRAHMPLRRTMDFEAPRIRGHLARAAQRNLRAAGGGH